MGPTFGTDHMSGSAKGSLLNVAWAGNKSFSTIGGQSMVGGAPGVKQGLGQSSFSQAQYDQYNQYGTGQFGQFEESQYVGNSMAGNSMAANSGQHFHDDAALNHTWQTNGRYLHQVRGKSSRVVAASFVDSIVYSSVSQTGVRVRALRGTGKDCRGYLGKNVLKHGE